MPTDKCYTVDNGHYLVMYKLTMSMYWLCLAARTITMGLLHTRGRSTSPARLPSHFYIILKPSRDYSWVLSPRFASGLFGACHCCVDVFVSCVFYDGWNQRLADSRRRSKDRDVIIFINGINDSVNKKRWRMCRPCGPVNEMSSDNGTLRPSLARLQIPAEFRPEFSNSVPIR
jgi:hypothetical protein